MTKKMLMVLGIVGLFVAAGHAQTFTDLAGDAQYEGKTGLKKLGTAIDANFALIESGGVAKGIDAFTVTASGTSTATFIGADAAGAANTEFDTTGAGTITVGSADVTAITLTTDGTGTGEVVLPEDSVGETEIDFANVTGADLTLTDCTAITASGAVTANGNTVLGNATNDSTTIAGLLVILSGIPTATNGLTTGCLWNDSGTVKIF